MNTKKIIAIPVLLMLLGYVVTSCQKLERPELKELILDPPPPPYNPVKAFFAFDGNAGDSGEAKSATTAQNITYVTGVNGQAAQIGTGGYVMQTSLSDSIKSPGSLSIAFWMNGTGPVVDGAQGLFSIANKNQYWGNMDLFLENLNAGDTAFLKIHMFNSAASDGVGEQWNEIKLPGALNKWTHIAVVYDSSTSKLSLYVDGAITSLSKVLDNGDYGSLRFKDVSGMVVGTYQFQTDPTLSNHGPESWASSFKGVLDQFRVYKSALTAAEVSALYSSKQ